MTSLINNPLFSGISPKYFPMISRMLITILRFTGKETFLPGKEISVTALSSLLKEVYAEK